MKKYSIILAAIAGLIFSACAESEEAAENVTAAQQTETYIMQEGDTQVSGEVISIIGNEVTLELGELTEAKQPSGNAPENGEKPDFEGFENGERPQPPEGEKPDFEGMENGERPELPEGEKPDFSNFDMDENGSGRSGGKRGRAEISLEKSGGSGTYIIPVGMTVSGLSGRSSDYSGISEGDILTLVIDSEGTVRSAEVR